MSAGRKELFRIFLVNSYMIVNTPPAVVRIRRHADILLSVVGYTVVGSTVARLYHIAGLGGGLDGHLAVFNGEQLHLGAALVVQLEQLDLGPTGPALGQGPGGGAALVVPTVGTTVLLLISTA